MLNQEHGIYVVYGSTVTNDFGSNRIFENIIGHSTYIYDSLTGQYELISLGNGEDGIHLQNNQDPYSHQAYQDELYGNSISANRGNGITVSNLRNTQIFDNTVGVSGTADIVNELNQHGERPSEYILGNHGHGIVLKNGTSAVVARNNEIAGNLKNGILITDPETLENTVINNTIGLVLNQAADVLGNGGDGIKITDKATRTSVLDNRIIGSGGHGVSVTETEVGAYPHPYLGFQSQTGISGNTIGAHEFWRHNGLSLADIGNGGNGIYLNNVRYVNVGVDDSGYGISGSSNVIANSHGDGIAITGKSEYITVNQNSIGSYLSDARSLIGDLQNNFEYINTLAQGSNQGHGIFLDLVKVDESNTFDPSAYNRDGS